MPPPYCQCEYVGHFGAEPDGHAYGLVGPVHAVRTDFGLFGLCRPCREAGHMVVEPGEAPPIAMLRADR